MTVHCEVVAQAAKAQVLRAGASFRGVGLHGGQLAELRIMPAPPGHGVLFRRTDLPEGKGDIPARWSNVIDTRLCTRLGNEHGASVGTVEHLMAALAGCGVTDALLLLNGPEVPIMDGSAAPFVEALLEAGIDDTDMPVKALRILAPIVVGDRDRFAALLPADRFEMRFSIDFEDLAIGASCREMRLTGAAFVDELCDARTFGCLSEVERLRAGGLARGGSLRNAIVVDRGRILNPEGLRHADEFVRHKMVDAIGDLTLTGAPIIGRFEAHRGGHELTNALLRALFARPDAWTWGELRKGQWFGGPMVAPVTRHPHGAVAV